MRSAVVVFNPFAGRRPVQALVSEVVGALSENGFDAEPMPSRLPGDSTERARRAAERGVEAVFALGGDGTLRECAAGLLGSQTVLGFLPVGTVNVMALELGIPARPLAAARALANARAVPFGVGLANGSPFLMQASAGIDAFLIAQLRPREKKLLGRGSALPAIIRSLARYSFPTFGVSDAFDSQTVTLAVVSNIRRYGGPWKLTPGALHNGETLELFTFTGRGRVAVIFFALSLLVGRQLRLSGSLCRSVARAVIDPVQGLPFQIDGDVLGADDRRALVVETAPHTIRMLVPSQEPVI